MRKLLWIGLSLLLLITSCGSKNEKSNSTENAPAVAAAVNMEFADAGSGSSPQPNGQKLIRQGTLRLQVDSISTVRTYLTGILQKHKAYIASENENRFSGNHENTIVIRVPGEQLEALVNEISGKAKFIDTKELSSEDVGMEYMDIQARVKAKLEMEKRYLQLLQRAGKVSEMLEVENQLGSVRGEIESMEGRLKYFDNKVSYATLTLSLYEVLAVKASPGLGFFTRAAQSFQTGFDLVREGILIGISFWPLILLLGIVITIIRLNKPKLLIHTSHAGKQ